MGRAGRELVDGVWKVVTLGRHGQDLSPATLFLIRSTAAASWCRAVPRWCRSRPDTLWGVPRRAAQDWSIWIALLRGVNVGRGNQLGMAELRGALEVRGGFDAVRTLGRSGNLVLRSEGATAHDVADQVGGAVAAVLGKRVAVIVRSAAEFADVIAANPIPEAEDEGSRLHVMFLDHPLTPAERAGVEAIEAGSDVINIQAREIYVWYRAGMSGSDTAERLVRALDGTVTDRNWNTVLKLDQTAGSISV